MAKISTDEIDLLAGYIFKVSGIHLDRSKGYLLENRLKHMLALEKCADYATLHSRAVADASGRLKKEIIDAISTNETYFFRDNTPFDLLKNKIIPDLIDRRRARTASGPIPLRIWSAACSSGQEVYSIGITLLEMLPNRNDYDISILGTDISNQVVSQASYGKYNQFEVERGLPQAVRQKYFSRMGDAWRIKDEVRVLAKFDKLNLMDPFPNVGRFDIVFCRNVAIYFTQDNKVKLFRKIASVLQPDGSLIVGGSENLAGMAPDFTARQYLRGMFYQLKGFDPQESVAAIPSREAAVQVRPVRPRPVSRRKTVYDRPRRPVSKEKPLSSRPPEEETKHPQAKPVKTEEPVVTDTAVFPPESPLAEEPLEETSVPPRLLSDKLAADRQTDHKESLLGSLGARPASSSSLLSEAMKDEGGKKSLLEKIRQQQQDGKEE